MDAAGIRTGSSQRGAAFGVFPLVNAGHIEAQLRRANRRDVATRAAADDDGVEILTHILDTYKKIYSERYT